MFSFRRKPKKEPDTPRIRTSPSLPELNSQGIPWPEDLVDIAAIRGSPPPDAAQPTQGATKTSFQSEAPIPFHKPFGRPSIGGAHDGPISSLYMAGPPATFDKKVVPLVGRYSQRRVRIPPTFNLMVVGGKGTGKTSLLRLLLETADTSPARRPVLKGSTKATQAIQTACVEICESRFDRSRELKLERQVNTIIKYESKVVRQSKGDQHIHLPASIITAEQRRAMSSLPVRTRSETTVSMRPPELVPDTSSADESDDEEEGPLTMSPAEIRVIRRLSARTNVLPVIARADSLTDEKLLAVKNAVRTGLAEAGIDFGVFGPMKKKTDFGATPKRQHSNGEANGNGHGNGNGNPDAIAEVAEEEERRRKTPRPIIKIRPTRLGRGLSRSRSRRDLSQAAQDDHRPVSPDNDRESIANVRFSAHIVAKTDLSALLPFALIAPEANKARLRPNPAESSATLPSPSQQPSEDGSAQPDFPVPQTPVSVNSSKNYAFMQHPPEDLKGVFVRKFRWGTVDVLDPNHCDFAALRTAVLSTHLKLLKTHTKEVLYEKYRTEKLLARRATSHISAEETERLLEGLGL
ncbi:septin family protein [Pholiota molesta]|nr:septin family protein [Pholiota molesta]